MPFIGVEVNSAQRWIDLYFLPRFQPIELVKPFLIILIGSILCSEKFTNIYFKYILSFFSPETFIFVLYAAIAFKCAAARLLTPPGRGDI